MCDLFSHIAGSHPKLERGQVWCRICGNTFLVNAGECILSGWPQCCGETMTVDSPEERKCERTT
jgi:hypothetical protein